MAKRKRALSELLSQVPTALFAMALGLTGLGAAFRLAGALFELAWMEATGVALLIVAAAVLVVDTVLYLGKLVHAHEHVKADLGDSTSANLIAPAFMATMIIGSQLSAVSAIGLWLWAGATIAHLLLLLHYVGRWVTVDHDSDDLNPTWFLPAAGIMTASMAAPDGVPAPPVYFVFATGLTLWLILLPLCVRRTIFEPALPPPMRPSLFIFAAPFGLAASSLMRIAPGVDPIVPATLAFGGAFFIFALIARPRFIAKSGISLGWWGTTFPVATVAAALMNLAARSGSAFEAGLGLVLLAFAALSVALAIAATVRVAWNTWIGASDVAESEIAALRGGMGED